MTSNRKLKVGQLLYLVLLSDDNSSILPELFDVFGEDLTLKFLDIFSGQTIVCPSKTKLSRMIRDIDMYIRVVYNKESISTVADSYEVSKDTVENMVNKLAYIIENRNINIPKLIK